MPGDRRGPGRHSAAGAGLLLQHRRGGGRCSGSGVAAPAPEEAEVREQGEGRGAAGEARPRHLYPHDDFREGGAAGVHQSEERTEGGVGQCACWEQEGKERKPD